ncbi:MAG: hypothetical protein EBW47_08485, partial [Betaproteobacteria bacterium]|nr:hypothetical protein [Betaproteobacteria bacterium]
GVSVFKTGEYYGLGGSAGANWTNGLVDARAVYVPNSGNAMGSISFGVDLLISGVIQTSNSGDGKGGIVKNGQGTMALSAQNTYTGGTIVNAGKLILGGMENDGVGTIRGTLTVNEGAVVDYTQTMNDIYNGSHSFGWKAGESVNVLNINGGTVGGNNFENHFAGGGSFALNMTGGELKLGGTNNPTAVLNAAILSSSNQAVISGINAAAGLTVDNKATFTVADGSQNVDLLFSAKLLERTNGSTGQLNVGQLEKAGAGTMLISGTNSLRGTNLISGGTLRAGTAQSFGLNAALVLSNTLGVTADFNGFNQTIGSLAGGGASGGTVLLGTNNMTLGTANANTSFGGLIDGSGSVIKVGTGTQTLTSANTYSGGTFLNAGGITIGHGRALGTGDLTFVSNNTVLGASASVTLTNRVALNANGIVDTAANSLTMSGVISGTGSLTKQGSGVLNLLGTNTYTGVNNLLGGTLALGNSQAISGNTVTVASNSTVLALANLNLSNAVTLNSGRIGSVDTGGFDVTWDGLFSGAGGLGKLGAGTLFLLKDNVYSGSTTISQGVVQLGNGGNSGDIGTGTVTNNAKLIINRGGTFTLTNLIVGTGSVEVNGTATVSMGALSAANTYSGGTVVNGGTVLADGPNNATLGTFGTGLLTINNGGRVFVTRDNSTRSTSGYLINAGGLLEISNGVTLHLDGLTMRGGKISSASSLTGSAASYGSYNLDTGLTAGGVAETSEISALGGTLNQSGGTVLNVLSGATNGVDLLISGSLITVNPST